MSNLILQSAGLTKASAETLAGNLIQAFEDSDDKISCWAQVKAIEKALETVKETVRPDVVRFAEQMGVGKKFEHRGVSFELKDAGVKYDYTNCQDVIWNTLNERMKDVKAALDERQKYLQSLKSKTECFDPLTGEFWTAYPPVRKATETVEVRLK